VVNCASKDVGFAKDDCDNKIGDDSTEQEDILTTPGEYNYVGGSEQFYWNAMIHTFTNQGLFYLSSSSIQCSSNIQKTPFIKTTNGTS
jgi:hypothetical protein